MTTDTDTKPAPVKMEQEQAADLAALHASAAEEPALPGDQNEPAPANLAAELEGLTGAVVMVLSPLFPSLSKIYTDETTKAATGSVATLCKKHGWLEDGLMGNFAEEIACGVVTIPMLIATVVGIRGDIAKRKQEQPAKPVDNLAGPDLSAKAPPPATGQSSVTFGNVAA